MINRYLFSFSGSFMIFLLLISSPLYAQVQSVPNIQIVDNDGLKHDFASCLESGKVNIVVVWRGCCVDGISLLEELGELINEDADSVALLAVSCDDSRNNRKVAGQVKTIGYEGVILIDENQDLARAIGISVFPSVLFTQGNKQIVWKTSGYAPGLIDEIEQELQNLKSK